MMGRKQTLEGLDKKEKELQDELKRIQTLKLEEQRKQDHRRKLLAGEMVLKKARSDATFRHTLAGILDAELSKAGDRELFKEWLTNPTPTEPKEPPSATLEQRHEVTNTDPS